LSRTFSLIFASSDFGSSFGVSFGVPFGVPFGVSFDFSFGTSFGVTLFPFLTASSTPFFCAYSSFIIF